MRPGARSIEIDRGLGVIVGVFVALTFAIALVPSDW